MSSPISSVSGLASGIQWQDMIDQIMQLEQQRRLDPVTTASTKAQSQYDAWGQWQSLVAKFRDTASALRDPNAFAQFQVSGGTSPATGRTLFTATASAGAVAGTYDVEVQELARANKMSGAVQASASTALGLSGEFAINGSRVAVTATDTLGSIRDKINALNAGSTPTGVTASVLSTGSSEFRLVLTADHTGAAGIELVDDSAGTLQSLGLVDGSTTLNIASVGGGAQSFHVSSSTAAIATMLGVTMPPPSTINIGGHVISVDLSVDSLASIAARIMAAGGDASVVSAVNDGQTSYRLVTSDTVSASTADGTRALEVLGFLKSGRAGVAQVVTSANSYSDGVGATATGSTLLSDLQVAGNPLGLAAGDTFVLQGTRGDGSVVNLSFTVGASDTLQTLVDKLNDATSGYGAGSRTATASIVNGQIVLTDGTAGDSQLSLSMSVAQSGGGIVNIGRMNTSAVGRLREVVAGSDAVVKLDGVTVRRSSNTISDAMAGVTFTLQQAEPGAVGTLTIGRDSAAILKTVGDLATAYNDILKFRDSQSATDAPLHNNVTLRTTMSSITNLFLTNVTGVSGSLTSAPLAGLSLQKDGTLSVDANAFTAALNSNLVSLASLFNTSGTTTNSDVSYFVSTGKTTPGTYSVDITTAATTASVSGAGFSGTYVDDGTPDTMTVTDSTTGASGDVSLSNGDTIDIIVARLNAMFASNKMNLAASKNGNDLKIEGTHFGSAATFTVGYTAGGADGSAQLGIAAGTVAGTDVVGTIGGLPATGSGQMLTGASGGATDGLTIMYTGAATGNQGTINFVLGLGGTLFNAADSIARAGGAVATQQDALQARINELQTRADTVQQALDAKRAALTAQFVAMESALSQIQQQATSLTNFMNQLNASSKG